MLWTIKQDDKRSGIWVEMEDTVQNCRTWGVTEINSIPAMSTATTCHNEGMRIRTATWFYNRKTMLTRS